MTGTPLDYEDKRSYTVTVTASDGTDSDEIQVTIDVTDVLGHRPRRPRQR